MLGRAKDQRPHPLPILQVWEPAFTREVIVLRLWLADGSDSRDASLLCDLERMRNLKFPFPSPGWFTATQAPKLLDSLRSLQHRSVWLFPLFSDALERTPLTWMLLTQGYTEVENLWSKLRTCLAFSPQSQESASSGYSWTKKGSFQGEWHTTQHWAQDRAVEKRRDSQSIPQLPVCSVRGSRRKAPKSFIL